jgi:anti-sigma regulatory factor (Ser/Thr protein kinase)
MQPFQFSIDLPVLNLWKNVDLLLTSVQNCFVAVFADVDGCNAISMVTGELVENAIKYGYWSGHDKHFRLRINGRRGAVAIQVENPVDPGNPQIHNLEATLRWIAEFPNTETAYRTKMLEIASQPGGSSGFGLVRCAYEGSSILRAELVDGNALRVVAEMTF